MEDKESTLQKYETYKYVTWAAIGLAILAFPALIAVTAGATEPYISPPSRSGFFYVLSLIVAVGIGGYVANQLVADQHWKAVGREAGLSPAEDEYLRDTLSHDDDAMIGKSILSGKVRGRPVRARVYSRSKDSDDDGDTDSSTTYTVVETDLKVASEEGAIINPAEGGLTDTAEGTPEAHDDEFAVLASVEDHAQALISDDAREALLAMDEFTLLFVGDAKTVYEEALPDYGEQVPDVFGFSVGSMIQDGVESMFSSLVIEGDPRTVSHRTEGVIFDPDELRRHVEGVVTAAEVFEEAKANDETA